MSDPEQHQRKALEALFEAKEPLPLDTIWEPTGSLELGWDLDQLLALPRTVICLKRVQEEG